MKPFFIAAVTLLCLFSLATCAPRDRVSFDFGWRFHLGDDSKAAPNCSFSKTLTKVTCTGDISYCPVHDDVDCQLACCSGVYHPGCTTWYYEDNRCFLGSDVTCKSGGKANGGQRVVPPKMAFPFSDANFDDSKWDVIDVPHDFVIHGDFSQTANDRHGYLPRGVGWYRKHFKVPEAWAGGNSRIFITFDGAFHVMEVWINGKFVAEHSSGYTSPVDRIDKYLDPTITNVIAIRIDATFGTGHWYEGGGLYRHVWLTRTEDVFIDPYSLYVPYTMNQDLTSVTLKPEIVLRNTKSTDTQVHVVFTLMDDTYVLIKTASVNGTLAINGTASIAASMVYAKPHLWSIKKTYLYHVKVTVMDSAGNSLDNDDTTVGFRSTRWDANHGFFLNEKHTIFRGFSDHNDFAGVGTAVQARINLYRAQMLRRVGGNSWRMSHNPGDPVAYDILDSLGIMCWDENRDYTKYQVGHMSDMVMRDRNHASIVIWSFCNEVECYQLDASTGQAFRDAVKQYDKMRPVSANMDPPSSQDLSKDLDVQGYSHFSLDFDTFHKANPNTPMVSSESSSCPIQRGENIVNASAGAFSSSFDGPCLSWWFCSKGERTGCQQSWTKAYDPTTGTIKEYIAGTLGVWTLFDYIGEPTPHNWPQVSCNYGIFDLAGFAKGAVAWYRSWWLCNITESDYGRPDLPQCDTIEIQQVWDGKVSPPYISVYSNAPVNELLLNGKSLGVRQMGWANWTQWNNVSFKAGTLKAVGYSHDGRKIAEHSITTPGAPKSIRLSLDAPSVATGTGTSLYADGQDVALVRAEVIDAEGRLCTSSSISITFSVTSGPGVVIGVGNGDSGSHEKNKAKKRTTYHGLARAVVQVTENHVTDDRELQKEIDVDGGVVTKVVTDPNANLVNIVLKATAFGLGSTTIEIPVSTQAMHSPLAVAYRQE